jgi:glycosyltransferase involved in cell wall biosynthesis
VRRKPTLLFISPQFLFPLDAGGKIRSANVLRHLKGGAFETRLLMPATTGEEARWKSEIGALADEIAFWRTSARNALWKARRAIGFLSPIPISARADADAPAKRAVAAAIGRAPDLVVFDYVQSAAMAPKRLASKSLFFAHNVETEILQRHADVATGVMKPVWSREAAKMRRFERATCVRTDAVIAVSERDADAFRRKFGAARAFAIPTGVDPDFFSFAVPPADGPPRVVFTGSMDWKANQQGLSWFMNEVWPLIAAARPDASFAAIGKNPPRAMVEAAAAKGFNWRFTGFVDDVREHARGQAYVIPLRVGGGTRIKAYEAMAMGVPVVSTALGVEGLPVTAGEHFLLADDARGFSAAVVKLLAEPALRERLAVAARRLVEENFSHAAAARVFERHCLAVLGAAR